MSDWRCAQRWLYFGCVRQWLVMKWEYVNVGMVIKRQFKKVAAPICHSVTLVLPHFNSRLHPRQNKIPQLQTLHLTLSTMTEPRANA
jgi:hypothetical protein